MKVRIFRSTELLAISAIAIALFGTSIIADDNTRHRAQSPVKPVEVADADTLRLSVWEWASGGELTLFANGDARHTEWLRNGSWQILESGTMVLTHPNGLSFFVNFKDEKSALIVSANGRAHHDHLEGVVGPCRLRNGISSGLPFAI